MKTIMRAIFCIIILFYSAITYAKPDCSSQYLAKHPHAILSCYIALHEEAGLPWVIDNDDHDPRGVSIETYQFNSQQWPKPNMSQHASVWKHTLVIYRPDTVSTHQALLFVNGGSPTHNDPQPLKLDFAKIALATQSIIVDLQDVPEQALTLDDNVPRKEDSLVAYTWSRYLTNPATSAYWPLQVPMTKSVVKAMDAVQQIIEHEVNFKITHFVVSGVSKRGSAVWLAALADNRINAIVPIVINTVNIKPMLDKTYSSYNKHWPPAFHDYVSAHISDQIEKPEFAQLIKVIDPYSYLNCDHCEAYKQRLSIPKYIINASGDDFFVPDSLNVYLDKLPGENLVRITPNENHAIDTKIIEDSLLAYYESLIYQIPHPHIHWTTDKTTGALQTVSVQTPPVSVKLWEAENPDSRDFRKSQHIKYTSTKLAIHCKGKDCEYTLNIAPPEKGWKAAFVEFTYQFTNGDNFVLTTPAFITAAVAKPLPIANKAVEKAIAVKATAAKAPEKIAAIKTAVKTPVIKTPDKTPAPAHPVKLTEKIKNIFIKMVKMTEKTKKPQTEKKMAEKNAAKTHPQLVDVVALSKKECAFPIRVHLAYATRDNFTGQIVDGYTPGVTGIALMTQDAAEALIQVQNDLIKNHHLGLQIYDSYRPRRAVKQFVRWSMQPVYDDHEFNQKLKHYPDIEKSQMFKLGYVSEDSQHCYGHTVDLVLVDKNGHELNHGTIYDFMGTKSHIDATAKDIGEEALKNRTILSDAMNKYGFISYPAEYWHFSFKHKKVTEPMDFPITAELKGLNVT